MIQFHNDSITLYRNNVIIAEGLKADVQPREIFIHVENNKNMPNIKSNDIIEHKQSDGVTERYQVINPNYHDKMLGKHYQCEVKKMSAIEHPQHSNIHINAAQINIASDNAIINATNNGIDLSQLKTLIEAVKQSISSDMSKEDVETVTKNLGELETQLAQPMSKKSVVKSLLTSIKTVAGTTEFVANVANLVRFTQSFL